MPRDQFAAQSNGPAGLESFDLAPFVSPATLWTPQYVSEASAWLEHIPFAFWLIEAWRPGCIVELGTHTGVSYLAMCEAVQRLGLGTRCYAVDTWAGDTHTGFYGDEVLHALAAVHDPRYRQFSRLVRSTFDEAVAYFEDGSIDLLHIDGLHTYEAVRHDFETWRPKLASRAIVLFHDTNVRERDFGVFKLWRELADDHPHFQFLHGHGLGVLALGTGFPPKIAALLDAGRIPQAAQQVRALFARLGGEVALLPQVRSRNVEQERLAGELATSNAKVAELEATVVDQRARLTGLEHKSAKVAELETTVVAQRARLTELDGLEHKIAALEQARATPDQRIVALEHKVATSDASVALLQAELVERRGRVDELHALLARVQAQALYLAGEKVTVQASAEAAQKGLASAEQHARQLEADVLKQVRELRRLKRSLSWRLTRPLRVFGGIVKAAGRGTGKSVRLLCRPIRAPLRKLALNHHALRGLAWALRREDRTAVRDVWVLRKSGLFDADWYRQQYRDVGKAKKDPVIHYVRSGARKCCNPSRTFDTAWYLQQNADVREAGTNPLVHYVLYGMAEGRRPAPAVAAGATLAARATSPLVNDTIRDRFPALQPLPVYFVPDTPRRLTMVTDSINKGSLYGGVGTAIIFSALLARALGVRLRIATRTQQPREAGFGKVLDVHGIDWRDNVEFVFAGPDCPAIDVGEDELFLTTSWWTTWCTRDAVGSANIVYLLQEDERMFYPAGDDYLRCTETMSDPHIRYVINTEDLYHYFVDEGFSNIANNGCWFEPAFPKSQYYLERRQAGGKKNFFFYARPGINVRNLYYRGLEAINRALELGILQPEEWQFHFVGRDLVDVTLAKDVRPRLLENLEWADYAALVRTIDVGLSLMYTPHPSYPPLDLAASGAVVVTNRYDRKTSLDHYSKNIICADTAIEALVDGLQAAVTLAADWPERTRNYENSRMLRDWQQSFQPILDRFLRD